MMKRIKSSEKLIEDLLNESSIDVGEIFYYDAVTSTMDVSANLKYDFLEDFTIVVADEQTKGRGRNLKKWYGSSRDCMFSIILKQFDFSIPYSMIASLGVYDVLKPLSSKVRLKWINDVFWGPKKIAGILTEEKNNRTVIGVGVNINSSDFPSSISNDATSLFLETGINFNKIEYLVKFIKAIVSYINEAHGGGVERLLKKWERASKMNGVLVKVINNRDEYNGIVQGINYKTGALKLKIGNEIIELYDGTLSFL